MDNLFVFNKITISYSKKGLGPKIINSRDVYELLIPNWIDVDYCEFFYVVLINRGSMVLGVKKISTGSVSGTVADPKKIFQTAMKAKASAVILFHNHPSGQTQPSQGDKKITEKCVEAGKFPDLPLIDHIIVTRNGYFSFADDGFLQTKYHREPYTRGLPVFY